MEWRDRGVILATRKHGETSVIVEAFTENHGRHLGLIRGGRSRRMAATLQPGNQVDVVWRARLEDHLGAFTLESTRDRAAHLLDDRFALDGFLTLAAHVRLLPERDPHSDLFDQFETVLAVLGTEESGPMMACFEHDLLAELGFGLDLSECAATGLTDDLRFVSPKSGRAVSERAAAPYEAKLLPLPQFLVDHVTGLIAEGQLPASDELAESFRLTGYFLDRHVWQPRRLAPPAERLRFVSRATQQS
ncbi:MAG: DNA repair protein RecO [Pseudomonadota bacterium]